MLPLRLVIDTNVIVSAALKPEGLQHTTVLLAITKHTRLYVSQLILDEYAFHPSLIEWRVTNTAKSGKVRGTDYFVCGPPILYGSPQLLVHSCRLDPEVYRPYQCQLRAESRPEDSRKAAGLRLLRIRALSLLFRRSLG